MNIWIDKAYYTDWEFIRWLRNLTSGGFISQHEITKEEHQEFMLKNHQNYYVALKDPADPNPIGFVAVVDRDIRFAVHPDFQGKSIGTKMLKFVQEKFPTSFGKVKKDNAASNKAFEKAGYHLFGWDNEMNYYSPVTWSWADEEERSCNE